MKLMLNNRLEELPNGTGDETLLYLLRETLGVTSPKYGCGVGQCGACTVWIDGVATKSCTVTLDDVAGKGVRTLEGLADDPVAAQVKRAWVDTAVAQCGYCQTGQIMAAVALLKETPKPSDADINAAMDGNLCRCGTYTRIRKAIKQAAEGLA